MNIYLVTIRGRRSGARIERIPVAAASRAEARRKIRAEWLNAHILRLDLQRPGQYRWRWLCRNYPEAFQ